MREDLTSSIQEAIRKNLPAEVSDVLRKRLDMADKLEKEIADHRSDAKKFQQEINKLQERIRELREFEILHKNLLEKQADLKEWETKLDTDKKVMEAVDGCRRAHVTDMKELVAAVFSNNRFKYATTKNIPYCNSCLSHVPSGHDKCQHCGGTYLTTQEGAGRETEVTEGEN